MRTLTAGAPVALADDDLLIAGDNLTAMATLPNGAFDMAYLDPPFNTGSEQRRGELAYADAFADYAGFLAPRLERVRALLAPHGTLYLHLDYRESHRCKLALDDSSARSSQRLIWIYDYCGRPKRRWRRSTTDPRLRQGPRLYHFRLRQSTASRTWRRVVPPRMPRAQSPERTAGAHDRPTKLAREDG